MRVAPSYSRCRAAPGIDTRPAGAPPGACRRRLEAGQGKVRRGLCRGVGVPSACMLGWAARGGAGSCNPQRASMPAISSCSVCTVAQRPASAQQRARKHRDRQQRHEAGQRTQQAQVFEVIVLDELHDDVLVRLDLQHLEDEAHEGRWLGRLAVHAAHLGRAAASATWRSALRTARTERKAVAPGDSCAAWRCRAGRPARREVRF